MLLLRPDLVDPSYRTLPPARYSLVERAGAELPAAKRRPGVRGPSRARRSGIRQGCDRGAHGGNDGAGRRSPRGNVAPSAGRSPFFALPFLRTEFWPVTVAATLGLAIGTAAYLILGALGRKKTDGRSADRRG